MKVYWKVIHNFKTAERRPNLNSVFKTTILLRFARDANR